MSTGEAPDANEVYATGADGQADERYRDASLPVGERVEDLLGRMTLEEKIAQLTAVISVQLCGQDGVADERLRANVPSGIGEISMPSMLSDDPRQLAQALNDVQRFLVDQTRLGIPAIAHDEALSGFVYPAAAEFPTAIALGAAWDPASVEAMTAIVGQQMRSLGLRQAMSPVLDVARDARWGRVQETYGEDPYLVSALGVAFVRGLQGPDLGDGVLATAKHFVGYSMSEGGRNLVPVHLGGRELREVHARPFAAAIHEAGLASVMCAYSDVNGEPVAGSHHLLTDLLRGELGFSGFVVADYISIDYLHNRHETAADPVDAGIQALTAGLDVELPQRASYGAGLVAAVRSGLLDEEIVECSVRRVLAAKFRLGLFENPFADVDAFEATGGKEAGREVARRLAERSTVLLANDRGVLPLGAEVRCVAVIGPNADSVRNLFGGYSGASKIETAHALSFGQFFEDLEEMRTGEDLVPIGDMFRPGEPPPEEALAKVRAAYPRTPTVLSAIRGVAGNGVEVAYAQGCSINDPNLDGIAEAVDLAAGADVAVLVLGDRTGLVYDATAGEGRDRSTLELPGGQRALLDAVCATGTPVVVVLVGSRPVPVIAAADGPAAVVAAWLPGSIGGVAIADVLFGHVNPSGRLPITIPRTAGQCPIFHGRKPSGEPESYTDLKDSAPAYAFGHGLSYTTFAYNSIEVADTSIAANGSIGVTVGVVNTGHRSGEEVVQLYGRLRRRGVSRPVRELIGFTRVELDPGATAQVRFGVPVEMLAYYDTEMKLVVTPGDVHLLAGGSSDDLPLATTVKIVGDPLVLERQTRFLSDVTVEYRGPTT